MFNKKRIVVFGVFILSMFLFITFAGGTPQNQAIATRTVTFVDGYNNEELENQTIIVGEDATVPNGPTHDGRIFVGWYLNGNSENKLNDADFINITQNIRAVALYGNDANRNGVVDEEDVRYTVTFIDTYTNTVLSTQEVLVGMDAIAPALPTHENMTFVGWSTSYRNITRNTTVNTTWRTNIDATVTDPSTNNPETPEVNRYTVTFIDGFDNSVILISEVEEGLTATTPEAPTHVGYTFTGWAGNLDNIRENTTVTATYKEDKNGNNEPDDEEKEYQVTYESLIEGTTGTTTYPQGTRFIDKDTYTVLENTFTLDKSIFIGWTTEREKATKIVESKTEEEGITLVKPGTTGEINASDVTYYAVWAINNNGGNTPDYNKTYTVTFEYDGKTKVVTDVTYGSTVAEPEDVTKEGYTYTWDRELTNITSDTTITATYKVKTYTVKLIYGLTGETEETQIVDHGKDVVVPGPAKIEGYILSWDGNLENITEDTILTASYKADTNKDGVADELQARVKYVDYDNAEILNVLITKGEKTPTVDNPTRNGYVFIGWTPVVAETVTTDATYKASYKRILTVTYTDLKNGTGSNKEDVKHEVLEGTKDTEVPSVVDYYLDNTTYKFIGWLNEEGQLLTAEELPEVTENVTYKASYKRVLTVIYTGLKDETASNKADVKHEVLEGTKDAESFTPENIITLTNTYEFIGWKDKEGNILKTAELPEITENIVYEATYQKFVTVEYSGINGKIHEVTKQVETDETGEYANFENLNGEQNIQGFTFNGWNKPLPGSYIENTTIYAKYKQNIIDLTISQNKSRFNTSISETDLKNSINITPVYKNSNYSYLEKEELKYNISGYSNKEGIHTANINHSTLGNYQVTYMVYNSSLYPRLTSSTLKYSNPGKYIITSNYKYTSSKCVSDTYECNKEHKYDGVRNQEINYPFLELYVHKLDDKIVNSILNNKATITYNDNTKELQDVNNMNYGYFESHVLKDSAWYDIKFMIKVNSSKTVKYVEIPYVHEGKKHTLIFINENNSLSLLK